MERFDGRVAIVTGVGGGIGGGNPDKLVEAFARAIPLGRIGQPGDLPGAVAFFASDDAACVPGHVLSVSGGLTMSG